MFRRSDFYNMLPDGNGGGGGSWGCTIALVAVLIIFAVRLWMAM